MAFSKIKKLRAVFYARVSTEEEKQLNALVKQIQENKDIITEMGWEIVDQYIDEGKTGTTTKRRTEYQRLLEDMEAGKFDVVVVKDQDRLQRNTKDWYIFVDRLVVNKLQLYFYLDKKYYTPDDALITGVKAILAEEYSRNLSKKLNNSNRKRLEKALKGEGVSAMGNGKALGYKIENNKWVQVPEEIELCKNIFEWYLKYDSIRKVRDEVNNRGYTNSVGKPFTTESISRILKNEKAKGVIVLGRYHHDFELKKIVETPEEEWIRIPAPELAYVTDEVFEEVQKRLGAKRGKVRGVYNGSDALSGKLYCSNCGAVMWRRESVKTDKEGEKKKYYHWVCSQKYAKGGIACNKAESTSTVKIRKIYTEISKDLEVNKKAVKNSILEWLEHLKASLSDYNVSEKAQKDLDKLEKKKDKLTEAYLEEIISKEDYKTKYAELEQKIEECQILLVPVEENEDVKEIEETIKNIDREIDEYIGTAGFEDSKVDFLIQHTSKITVNGKHLIIELDLIAGAIIAGKDFLLFVHDSVYYCEHITEYTIEFKLVA